MGKSTISTGPFSKTVNVYRRVTVCYAIFGPDNGQQIPKKCPWFTSETVSTVQWPDCIGDGLRISPVATRGFSTWLISIVDAPLWTSCIFWWTPWRWGFNALRFTLSDILVQKRYPLILSSRWGNFHLEKNWQDVTGGGMAARKCHSTTATVWPWE